MSSIALAMWAKEKARSLTEVENMDRWQRTLTGMIQQSTPRAQFDLRWRT
jgi:hypothetical protein